MKHGLLHPVTLSSRLLLALVMLAFTFLLAALLPGCSGGSRPAGEIPVEPEALEVDAGEDVSPEEAGVVTGAVTGLEQVAVMPVHAGPKSVEVMPPDGKRIFVNDLYACMNFIFDADSYQLIHTVALGDEPVEADFTSDGHLAWVSLHNSSRVLVIDTVAGAIVGEVPTGSVPKAVAVSPDDRWVYVANWNSNTVSVIDAASQTALKNISVPGTPRGICFEPGGNFAYVCIMGGSVLLEVDVNSGHQVSRQIPCGSNPRHVVPSIDGSVLYVSNNSPGTITLIDRVAGAVQDVIKVGSQARTIALAPDNGHLFVCNYGDNTVGVVDLGTRKQVFTVPAPDPIGIAVSSSGDRVFISNYAPPRVTVMEVLREE